MQRSVLRETRHQADKARGDCWSEELAQVRLRTLGKTAEGGQTLTLGNVQEVNRHHRIIVSGPGDIWTRNALIRSWYGLSCDGDQGSANPYIIGVDFDNGSEFINYDVVAWAQNLEIYFTRSRPYKENDQATIESKNNDVVRKYAYYWRYDTQAALGLLNRLWVNVNDFMNYFAPTIKPIGWSTDQAGRRKRIYDDPKTPFDRLKDFGALTQTQIGEITAYRASLNPAELARTIATIQTQLEAIAKTSNVKLISRTTPLLPATNGIKHAS